MKNDEAIKLLDNVFTKAFDEDRFKEFIVNLFNDFKIIPKTVLVSNEYQDFIDSCQSFGIFTDIDNQRIEVLTVKLKRMQSRERARTMQRNFAAKILDARNNHAALVAFHGENPSDWRFSFVKMDYSLKVKSDGTIKPVFDLTPAKRCSFLVGEHEPNHTCRSQFLPILKEENFNPTIGRIEECFSIENVTQEFFDQYKALFLDLKESLESVIKKNPALQSEFTNKNISTIDFSKKLLGQIVFLYFLQKKGWLGVQKDPHTGQFKNWGTGPRNFMLDLFEKRIVPYENFFNDILEPLFYEALAIDRKASSDYYSPFKCKIPFLNGGLFEPINGYNWENLDILIENKRFEEIFEVFGRFNFTIKEDEPLEREVAVDPEVLGKVFENLLEIKDRRSRGAFYTPREIVHYMCQQSLIGYLENNTSIPRNDLETYVRSGDFALAATIREQFNYNRNGRGNNSNELFTLPKSIKDNYILLDNLLKDVKIIDPAVGSGAFPVGMMNEIVKVRSILTPFFSSEKKAERTNYALKRETIEHSLYGVDIDSSAVDIAKLRFWLALIVDEDEILNINPLPNLDHKIMCGDSLIEEFEGVRLFDERLLEEPEEDKSDEISVIDAQMEVLGKKLNAIYTGKEPSNESAKSIEKEMEKLRNKKRTISIAPKKDQHQWTLNQAFATRVKKSRQKLSKLEEFQKLFFNAQNRTKKQEYWTCIEKLEWDLIEETLKEEGNLDSCQKLSEYKRNKTKPFFIWKLYFSEIFKRKNPGFDIVIANPPYVSTRNETLNAKLQSAYKGVFGFQDDLYNYFYHKSFSLLRNDGVLSFISSNTFMTIQTKLNLRSLLQSNLLLKFIPVFNCFKSAEVEPIIVIAKKKNMIDKAYEFDFIDNRFERILNPEKNVFPVDIAIYRNAVNNVFFVPNPLNMDIYIKYQGPVASLMKKYWDLFNTSKKIESNREILAKYRSHLRPGEITMMGMITDGGQGLATGNNGLYVGVYAGTKGAKGITKSRPEKLFEFVKDQKIPGFSDIKTLDDAFSFLNNKTEFEIREIFDSLKEKYGRAIFGQGYLYRIVADNEIADVKKISAHEKLNGIKGDKTFVPYDKGDKEGNSWVLKTPYLIDWSETNVLLLKNDSKARWQGYQFFFKEGFCWNNVLNPKSILIKSRLKGVSVNDVASMSLYPFEGSETDSKYFICLLNSSFLFYYLRTFINNTVNLQMNDVRQIPIIIPTKEQINEFRIIFDEAFAIKEKQYSEKIDPEETDICLERLQTKLDKIVYPLYNVNEKMVFDEIQKFKTLKN